MIICRKVGLLFSVIVPVYNRPLELLEVLRCLSEQTFKDFEVLAIDDGSSHPLGKVGEEYENKLQIRRITLATNQGPGPARNTGMREAHGDYFVILDSDILLPENFLSTVAAHIREEGVDLAGTLDALHPLSDFFQRAVDYVFTSNLTTMGSRKGTLKGQFLPRGYCMIASREVFEKTRGFFLSRRGEDLEWSLRTERMGFRLARISSTVVYHARRNTLMKFFRQIYNFGVSRVILSRLFPEKIRIIHLAPLVALLCLAAAGVFLAWEGWTSARWFVLPGVGYLGLIFFHALLSKRRLGLRGALTASLLSGGLVIFYGLGMLSELIKVIFGRSLIPKIIEGNPPAR